MKITKLISLLFIIFLTTVQFTYGKTYKYWTYIGNIEIDDLNNQVVINSKAIYNIYDTSEEPMRLYMERDNGNWRMCLEFDEVAGFETMTVFRYKNNRFERIGSYKIMDLEISQKEPWIDRLPPYYIPSIKTLITDNEFGGNANLFESDTWFMKPVSERKTLILKYLIREFKKAKYSINKEFTSKYNDYSTVVELINNGEYDKFIRELENSDIDSAWLNLCRLGKHEFLKYLYYYDSQTKEWIKPKL